MRKSYNTLVALVKSTLIAGLLVEKYRYHLPLYRQHQRLEASGVTVSRGTLTNLEQRAGQLLQPVVHEVLNSCLESHTLVLDETPSKAGLKCKGKMKSQKKRNPKRPKKP